MEKYCGDKYLVVFGGNQVFGGDKYLVHIQQMLSVNTSRYCYRDHEIVNFSG